MLTTDKQPSLDSRRSISTPEGIAIEIIPAGPASRFYAWLIDFLIRVMLFFSFVFLFTSLQNSGFGILLIIIFLLEWFYPVYFEVLKSGMTPGKKAMGLKVIHDDATPVGWGSSLLRNLLRGVDILPGTYAVALVFMLFNQDFKRIGDIAAGTLVVHVPKNKHHLQRLDSTPEPPDHPLTPADQQTLLDFAARAGGLSPERQNELACKSAPLVDPAKKPTEKLLHIAAWVAGKRQ